MTSCLQNQLSWIEKPGKAALRGPRAGTCRINEVNQAEKGWKSISIRGKNVCKGPVAEGSMARVKNERRPAGLGSLEQRVWWWGVGRGRDDVLSMTSVSFT